jgi:5-methylcytosine-specific restriction endonuclease McrA
MATVSDKLCECGCGERTTLIAKTATKAGRVKGEPNRFVYGHARGWKHPNPSVRVSEEHAREVKRAGDRRFYLAHREERLEHDRAAYQADPDKYRAAGRASHARHRDVRNEAKRERRDPAIDAARSKAWREANPERVRELSRRTEMARRARKRGVICELVDPLVVLERDDGLCGICGDDVDPMRFHVDHIVPLARGGEHTYANVQTAHPTCNVRKGWSL